MTKNAEPARFVPAAEGDRLKILGDTVVCKGVAADGRSLVALTTVPPGSGVPVHRHPSPETFIMLSGELHFQLGEGEALRDFVARCGDIVVAPSNAWHAFSNRTGEHSEFAIVYDATLEAFFRDASTVAASDRPPSPFEVEHVMRTAAAHGMTIRA
jgi:quercetin dioxygenase-like cupin family protein